jgi:rare lipoprotein A
MISHLFGVNPLATNCLRFSFHAHNAAMKSKLLLLVLVPVLIVWMAAGCEQTSQEGKVIQTGVASWYGPGFHGRLTSSRERYDQDKLTAAHRTLPFNTIVNVINTENNETVEVRINDRGPYEQNRVIDLSRAAAKELDLFESGVTEVEIVLVEAGGPLPENLNRPTYTIQLGEYDLALYANRFADEVGDGVRIEQRFPRGSSNPVLMIYYGSYTTFSSALADLEELQERGFEGFVRQID